MFIFPNRTRESGRWAAAAAAAAAPRAVVCWMASMLASQRLRVGGSSRVRGIQVADPGRPGVPVASCPPKQAELGLVCCQGLVPLETCRPVGRHPRAVHTANPPWEVWLELRAQTEKAGSGSWLRSVLEGCWILGRPHRLHPPWRPWSPTPWLPGLLRGPLTWPCIRRMSISARIYGSSRNWIMAHLS